LKLVVRTITDTRTSGMNKQNPDRGIETSCPSERSGGRAGMNKQNPDRGIETSQPGY